MVERIAQEDCCCTLFFEALNMKGRRGMAVVLRRSPKFGDFFFLEFRALSEEDDEVILNTGSTEIMRRVEQAIRYCPWCGTELKTFYQELSDRLPWTVDEIE